MRPPLPKGFMKSGFFKWPEIETVKRKCSGCDTILEVRSQGTPQKWCKTCKAKRNREMRKRYYKIHHK